MRRIILFNILMTLILVSCGVPQVDFDALKEENNKLKKEIAECQLTPTQILEQAHEYYDALEYTKSKERLEVLIDKYPNSSETKKGKVLLEKVKKGILQAKKMLNKDKQTEGNNTEDYKKAIAKMTKKYDAVNEVTWYSDKSSIDVNTKSYFQIYIGKKDSHKSWLGFSINYFTKKDWLFIQRIEIDVDGKIYDIEEDIPGEFNSKEESGGKREWIDRVVKQLEIPMIKSIASGKKVKITFFGKENVDSRTLSKMEKKAMQNVLKAFDAIRELK
jgi:hypothetical protein